MCFLNSLYRYIRAPYEKSIIFLQHSDKVGKCFEMYALGKIFISYCLIAYNCQTKPSEIEVRLQS